MKTKTQKGFVLSEVLLAIAVIIIVGICIYPMYSANRDKLKVNHEVGFVTSLNTSIDKFFGAYHSLAGLNTAMMVDQGLMPSETIYKNGDETTKEIVNIWDGAIEINPDTQDNDKSKYIIVYRQLPSYTCIGLIKGIRSQYSLISVGGTYSGGTYSGGSVVFNSDKIDPSNLVTACTQTDKTDVAFVK